MREKKIKNQSNIEKPPLWFIIIFLCIIISSLFILNTLGRNFTDIEVVKWGAQDYLSEGSFERIYTINNTGSLPLWNLRMKVTAKNQENRTVFDNEVPITSALPKGELTQAFFMVGYKNNTLLNVDIEFKWNYFDSEEYHEKFRINDVNMIRWNVVDNWTLGPHQMWVSLNNTGEAAIGNLRVHARAKNQENRLVYENDTLIIYRLAPDEILDAPVMINYGCNDSELDISLNFTWDFFRSKEYHVRWKQDTEKILLSQNKYEKTLTVLGVVKKNLRWENNVAVLEGYARLPSGIIKEGDVITNCSGVVTLGFVRNHQVIRYLGQWDFNQIFNLTFYYHD